MTPSPCLQELKKPPMWLAVHEAAHAVAAVLLGKKLGWEWIPVHELAVFSTPKPNGQMGYAVTDLGSYSTRDEAADAGTTVHFFEEDEAFAEIIQLLAGPLAEARHRRKAEDTILYGTSDLRRAQDVAQIIANYTSRAAIEVFRHGSRKAAWIVHSEWFAIKNLAEVLRERGSMEGSELDAQLRALRLSGGT